MAQLMVCPPSPLGYTQYERRYYAGDWWYRVSENAPWQICKEEAPEEETDETLDYMCDLLADREINPDEFRRQMRSVGYDEETIRIAIWDIWDHDALSAGQ